LLSCCLLAGPGIVQAQEPAPQNLEQEQTAESPAPREAASANDPSDAKAPTTFTPIENSGRGFAVPVSGVQAIRNSLILEAPLDAAFGTMLSVGMQAGLRLTILDDWEISPRAGVRWRQVIFKKVNSYGGPHLENDSTSRWLPDAELLVAIPLLVVPTISKGAAANMWGTVYEATVPKRQRLLLVSGARVAFATGQQDWMVPVGLRFGTSSCGRVTTVVQTVEFLTGWWVQARALVLPRERRVGVDVEARLGDFFLYVEHVPHSDAQATPAGACPSPPCDLTQYPYSSFHGAPGASQTLAGVGAVLNTGWGL
jgi:hypothetical protein